MEKQGVGVSNTDVVVQEVSYEIEMGTIEGSFIDNSAIGKTLAQGGALEVLGKLKGAESDFYGNYVKSNEGETKGGAVYLEGEIEEGIKGDFVGNYAEAEKGKAKGGAMAVEGKIGKITGDFVGNYVVSLDNDAMGGAIYNEGIIGNISGLFIGNSAVSGNDLSVLAGGAIYNTGTISFSGTNVFQGNMAGSKFNDIHNDGEIIVDGELILDAGITGNGKLYVRDGAILKFVNMAIK